MESIRLRGRPEEELRIDGKHTTSLGASLRAWRRYRGLTVTDLAVRMGLGEKGRSYISQVEHGYIQRLSEHNLQVIVNVLGIDRSDLLECKVPLPTPEGSQPLFIPSDQSVALTPDDSIQEYTGPHLTTSKLAEIQSTVRQHGATILGIYDVPDTPLQMELNGIHWKISLVGDKEYRIPPSVYERTSAIQKCDVIFSWWLYGEEDPIPNNRSMVHSMLIGVVAVEPSRGMWCLLGKWMHEKSGN
jgi:transcriptional regulator with XRE-family HTH domain